MYLFSAVIGFLAGGWVAQNLDTNQYIQIDLKEPYKFTAVHVQGREDQDQWVTSYQLYYSDQEAGPWNLYTNGSGLSVCEHLCKNLPLYVIKDLQPQIRKAWEEVLVGTCY